MIKTENTQWNRVTNRSAAYCNLYELYFSAWNYSFANEIDILHEEQKNRTFDASAQNYQKKLIQ